MTDHLTGPEALEVMLDDLIRESPGVVVLFTESACNVAEAVEPKVAALVRERFPALRFTVVSRSDAPALLAQLNVFVFPTVITWFGGKESARFVRTFSLEALADSIERPYELLFGS